MCELAGWACVGCTDEVVGKRAGRKAGDVIG